MSTLSPRNRRQAGEGVFGLQRGLQEAGAKAVLMSMWSVPDKETQELMKLFYEKWLSGMDKQEPLREAQQDMRATVKRRYGYDFPSSGAPLFSSAVESSSLSSFSRGDMLSQLGGTRRGASVDSIRKSLPLTGQRRGFHTVFRSIQLALKLQF